VCLADLAHQLATREPPLLVDRGRVGLRLPTVEHRAVDTLAYAQLRAERAVAAFAEEQRIIYVAMTRARERLILSGAARFARWPAEAASAIAWLGPALVGDLPARAGAGGGVAVLQGSGDVALALTLCTPENAEQLLGLGGPEDDGIDEGPAAPPADADPMPGAAAAMRVSAPNPPALSYTAIAEYERCAYRYHLQRVIGLPDVDPPGGGGDTAAAARGVVVHALLERLDFASPLAPSEREVADAAALAGVALGPGEDRGALAALAGAFARSPLCGRLARARDVRREEVFAFALRGEQELLRGFLDVAAVEPDGTLLIVDYKSDQVADATDLAAHVERDYSVQRLVYALAGLASGAPAVEVAHCFLRRPELLLATRFEAAERPRLEELLAARLESLRAGHFEVSTDPNRERCGSCPGRARLCSHEEVLTLSRPRSA
jgi:ATP-dependent exoDNAse (exonuclease V) beta subunit